MARNDCRYRHFLTPDPYADIARLIPHAVNWQVKELLSNRQGPGIEMTRLVQIIRQSNYRDYVPVATLLVEGKEAEYDIQNAVYRIAGGGKNMWFDKDEFLFAWKKMKEKHKGDSHCLTFV